MLLTFANDNYFLNVLQKEDINEMEEEEEKNEIMSSEIVFEQWTDLKEIDFNGWWIVEEENEDQNTISIKHFR